jgi:hypothetical protein
MNDTMNASRYEISNSCACRYCESCEMGTESLICNECQQDTRETSWCDGDCFEYKRNWFEEDVQRWLSAHNEPERVTIAGKHIGWQRLHGFKTINADHRDIFNAITFSGDWTLKIECDGDQFKIVRYSHDEPTGATFWLAPDKSEDESE